MTTAVLSHPTCIQHDPGGTHPEKPERLRAIHAALHRANLPLHLVEVPAAATPDQLLSVHTADHIQTVMDVKGQHALLDADTVASPASVDAALLAAGGAIHAADLLLDGKADNALVLVRPPGHHATPTQPMGFCFFNNVALAAARAHARGLSRVLVVDWDVHHGNGTQDAFYARPDVLFISTHQWPQYPGTGAATEVGTGEGTGHTVNVPLPAGADDGDFAAVFERVVLPVAHQYRPQLVLVSAGFDAHQDDPLGGLALTTPGFAALCGAVKRVAEEHAGGKLMLVLEGGYNTRALGESVVACAQVLVGGDAPPLVPRVNHSEDALAAARRCVGPHWKNVG